VRYDVVSPDGLPISPEPFDSFAEAEQALGLWCLRFAGQGFYSSVDGRIPLGQLSACCRIEAVADTSEARCTHNRMVERPDDPTHAWQCADCGHVYGTGAK
jgi:hypothetical protein